MATRHTRAKTPRIALRRSERLLHRIRGKRIVHLLHIGKTGGTAVKHALQDADTGRIALYLHPHRVRLCHLPPGDGVVFFLRDPIQRFISAFYARQRQGLPRYNGPWRPGEQIAFSRFTTPNALAVALSSVEVEVRVAAEDAMRSIFHVRTHYWDWFCDEQYLRARAGDILFVGRQETLAEGFERLKSILGLPSQLALPRHDVESHRNPAGLDRTLEAAAVENLEQWYGEDYRLLALCEELFSPERPAASARPEG